MGTYERKVNQLKDLMIRKYKSAYDKSKEMDIDISSMTYLPIPDAFNVINIEKMHVILDRVNKINDLLDHYSTFPTSLILFLSR